jgi:hypothetical protein
MLNGVKIMSNPTKAVCKAVFGTRLQNHLPKHDLLSPEAFHDMDWDATELPSEHFPPLSLLWMSKHINGFFGIGKMMKHWDFSQNQKCPCCHHIKEDKVHLLTCPEPSCAFLSHGIPGITDFDTIELTC